MAAAVQAGECTEARFERLMEAVEFGEVVPFLGAGISKRAEAPPGDRLGGEMHGYSMNHKLLLQVLRDCWQADGELDLAWWAFVKADLKLGKVGCGDRPPQVPDHAELLKDLEAAVDRMSKSSRKVHAKARVVARPSGQAVKPARMVGWSVRRPALARRPSSEQLLARALHRRSSPPERLSKPRPVSILARIAMYIAENTPSPLARLSELVAMRHGYVKLCDVLHLDRFTELVPTRAHTALARLLLEGAITEVITTNYDMCLERALARELGIDDAELAKRGELPDDLKCHLDVVDRASSYLGADSGSRTRRRPRYYKINGCAGAWRRASDAFNAGLAAPLGGRTPTEHQDRAQKRWRQAKRMVLTERQLQTFRAERWAEEMFRDRARSGHLLFCGFGNEEPQIRHTALAIMREFEDLADEDREGNDEETLWSLGAAPWFHQYGDQLQFFQMQVLHGWRHAWLREPGDPRDGATTAPEGGGFKVPGAQLSSWAPPRNAFTQLDREFFGLTRGGLTADAFWQAILREWWRRRYCAAWRSELPGLGLDQKDVDAFLALTEATATRVFAHGRADATQANPSSFDELLGLVATLCETRSAAAGSIVATERRYQPIHGPSSRTVVLTCFVVGLLGLATRGEVKVSATRRCVIKLSWPSELLLVATPDLPDTATADCAIEEHQHLDSTLIWVPSTINDLREGQAADGKVVLTDLLDILRQGADPGAGRPGPLLDRLANRLLYKPQSHDQGSHRSTGGAVMRTHALVETSAFEEEDCFDA